MKSVIHMGTKDLLKYYGKGAKGKKRISSEMVQWLLTDPPQFLLAAAQITKAPVIFQVDKEAPPKKLFLMQPVVRLDISGFQSHDARTD